MNVDSNMEVAEIAGEKPEAYLDCWEDQQECGWKGWF